MGERPEEEEEGEGKRERIAARPVGAASLLIANQKCCSHAWPTGKMLAVLEGAGWRRWAVRIFQVVVVGADGDNPQVVAVVASLRDVAWGMCVATLESPTG